MVLEIIKINKPWIIVIIGIITSCIFKTIFRQILYLKNFYFIAKSQSSTKNNKYFKGSPKIQITDRIKFTKQWWAKYCLWNLQYVFWKKIKGLDWLRSFCFKIICVNLFPQKSWLCLNKHYNTRKWKVAEKILDLDLVRCHVYSTGIAKDLHVPNCHVRSLYIW